MNQAGFTPSKSTRDHVETLWKLLDDVNKGNKKMWSFFLDLKSAFDSVDHEIVF